MTAWTTYSVHTKNRLKEMVRELEKSRVVAFDVETRGPLERLTREKGKPLNDKESLEANLAFWHPESRIVSISFTTDRNPEAGWVLPLSHPDGPWGSKWKALLRSIWKRLDQWDTQLVAHHGKFDLKWCYEMTGIDLRPQLCWDTMDAAHLIDENRSKRLKNLAKHLMGGDWSEDVDLSDSEAVPWFELAHYNAADTVATMRLYQHQREIVTGRMRLLMDEVVMPSVRTLSGVEHRGIMLDVEEAKRALKRAMDESINADMDLHEVARELGMDADDEEVKPSWEPTALWFKDFTERCVETGSLRIVETSSKTGNPSWRGGVLRRQADEGSVAEKILAYRHGTKQSQYLEAWLGYASPADDRVRASYRSTGTITGRLSSAGPNMQQVSRELKDCWRARDGWSFVEIDYSQIEVRIIAEVLHRLALTDTFNPLLQAYIDQQDVHTLTAAAAARVDPEDVTSGLRQKGKAVVFGFAFGMGSTSFQTYALETYGEHFTPDESVQSRRAFFDKWEGLAEWHDHQRETVRRDGKVTNLFGRVRHLPDAFSTDDYLASSAERQAINSPIQSAASDLMQRALSLVDQRLHDDGVRIIGTVHDSGLFEVREEDEVDLVEAIAEIMVDPDLEALDVELAVPLAVEASVGETWGSPLWSTEYSNIDMPPF